MKTNPFMLPIPKPGEELWGIYFTDREHAHEKGEPLRAVVAAPTKIAAEESALRLGLESPWARLLTGGQIKSIRDSAVRSEQSHTTVQPTTAELRTAIEVLKLLNQRLNDHAAHAVLQLPETELGDQYAAHVKAQAIEQTSHIEKVSRELQNWREELLQHQTQRMAQSV